jgi:hypothetical protein
LTRAAPAGVTPIVAGALHLIVALGLDQGDGLDAGQRLGAQRHSAGLFGDRAVAIHDALTVHGRDMKDTVLSKITDVESTVDTIVQRRRF